MKEKILEKLKIARGENTSISDRTLEKIADSLSVTVTEETGIAAAVEAYKPILAELEGNINSTAAASAKAAEAALRIELKVLDADKKPDTDKKTDDSEEPGWHKTYREAQDAKDLLVTGKLEGIEKAKQTETLVAQAKTNFYTKYQVSDAEKALCEKSLDLHLKLNPSPESADKIIEGWKVQYEDIRSAQGLGGLEPVASHSGGGKDAAGQATLKTLKDKLQSEGKIPKPETQNS